MIYEILPEGFNPIPAGRFIAGDHKGKKVAAFGMKATPLTNEEWGAFAEGLGKDRYVLLSHDENSGKTEFVRKGRSIAEFIDDLAPVPADVNFDKGGVMILGSAVLLKIVDNPSAMYDEPGKVFSGALQPATGISYFHAKAWCLLRNMENDGRFTYDLPGDLQYEYVASDRGTKKSGTETGEIFKGKRKLAHIDEGQSGMGVTSAVDDRRYVQKLPFGVQTTGNVWRWMRHNPQSENPYALRGGSYESDTFCGHADISFSSTSRHHSSTDGFTPVVEYQGVPPDRKQSEMPDFRTKPRRMR